MSELLFEKLNLFDVEIKNLREQKECLTRELELERHFGCKLKQQLEERDKQIQELEDELKNLRQRNTTEEEKQEMELDAYSLEYDDDIANADLSSYREGRRFPGAILLSENINNLTLNTSKFIRTKPPSEVSDGVETRSPRPEYSTSLNLS